MICKICGKEYSKFGFPSHIKRTHKLDAKEYYDTYIGKPNVCVCGKETPFLGLDQGYRKYCSQNCARRDALVKTREKYGVTNISQVAEVKAKMKQSIKDNWDNLTDEEYQNRCQAISKGTTDAYYKKHPKKERPTKIKSKVKLKHNSRHFTKSKESLEKAKQTNLKKYGVENPFQADEVKEKIKQTKLDRYNDQNYSNREKYAQTCREKYGVDSYVETQEFKNKVIENQKKLYNSSNTKSRIENAIMQIIKNQGLNVIPNKHLDNYYLDIYIPDLNTAIEYNGNYWHSIEAGKSKDYHLNKSIACRNAGIRLIHIYEFETFSNQINLLLDYIKGKDNYPQNDFNKNNFGDIPEPEVIFSNGKYTVYGAGKLY